MHAWKFLLTAPHLFAALAWLIAIAWLSRIVQALVMLPRVPDLLRPEYAAASEPTPWPSLAVVVPARNEAKAITATLQNLLAGDYPHLQIIAVDDRSTDATGTLMESVAAQPNAKDGKLRVLHVSELPEGWLGKPHAMALAVQATQADWLLFTDADVLFTPNVFRRAIAFAEKSRADHLVVYPTLILKGIGEHLFLAFFQSFSVWAGRAWKIPDPRAKRDFIGVGAFNLMRRSVYDALGGYESFRMEVLEDMCMGQRIKQSGYRQRVAFGRDMVRVRWAESAMGIVENLTKNMFAAFRFRISFLLAVCVGVVLLCLTPFVALFVPGHAFPFAACWAGVATFIALLLLNLRYWPHTRISPWYLVFFPVGTLLFLYAMLRSMTLTLWRGGVIWRGTLYPLAELRRHAGRLE
ncbi:MAG TPA: glycosyltransferase [Acidobacteriaceae bacterium]|jgi:glycosyltransferase involved in cell wall biosynthesis|nr:glycosyltransferase [Acidobacteriaceae bacterium]